MQVLIRTLLLGIVSGSVYALASTGLVLTYKTSGILNFGYGAVTLFTSFIYWHLTTQWGIPVWPAALIVLVIVAPLIGIFLDTQLFRRLEGQPAIINIIATVGLFVLLRGVVQVIWHGESHSDVPSLFPVGSVRKFGVVIGSDQIGVFLVAAAAAIGLGALLRFTKIGVAFRAVVNNRPVAGLMAINTGFVSGLAWALSISFAALTGILLTPRLFLDINFLPPFIIAFVLGAAVVGYMRSLPLAYAGGIMLGVIESLLVQYAPKSGVLSNLRDSTPFIFIAVAVIVAPKALRLAGGGQSFVVRTREIATRLSDRARLNMVIGGTALMLVAPLVLSGSWILALASGMTFIIIFLSLVVLTGYSGQISLGHTAFMGIAAFTSAHLATRFTGASGWLAVLIGSLAAVPAGALVGFLAVRLQGLYLALITLAFAFMTQSLLFGDTRVSGGEGGIAILRPTGAESDTSFYYAMVAIVALCAWLAVNLRTGRTGRILAGMRDSETACRALGIPVTKYKVLIFSLSAWMAGLGGIVSSMILQQANTRSFLPFFSLFYVTIAVVGGIFHVGGAIVAGLLQGVYFKLAQAVPVLNDLQFILFGLGATLALAKNPEGMIGELRRGAAAIQILASRRGRRGTQPLPVSGGQR
jgi:branched-chain amino acid transport system permease protein